MYNFQRAVAAMETRTTRRAATAKAAKTSPTATRTMKRGART